MGWKEMSFGKSTTGGKVTIRLSIRQQPRDDVIEMSLKTNRGRTSAMYASLLIYEYIHFSE